MRPPPSMRRAYLVRVREKVSCLYQLLQSVFVDVVTTTVTNVLADQGLLQEVVCVLTARFGGVSEDVVVDIFEETDVLAEFCNFDRSSDVLTKGEEDACLVIESGEGVSLEELKR